MAKFRAPFNFIIVDQLTIAQIKTLEADIPTYLADPNTTVIGCSDQLEASTLNIEVLFEDNMTQCSMAAANSTRVGINASFEISIGDDRIDLFSTATNAVEYGPTPNLLSIGDEAGQNFGDASLPFKTVIARPYEGQTPTTDLSRWIIFPQSGVKTNISATYGLQNQFSYSINMSAYDTTETGYKVLRGDPSFLP